MHFMSIVVFNKSESLLSVHLWSMAMISETLPLVLKSARRTEAHRVTRREAQGARPRRMHHGREAHFYAKIFKSISYFTKHILQK